MTHEIRTGDALAIERPVVRYHGGKWRLGTWVIRNLPPHRVYTEGFGGAFSVCLRKPKAQIEVYNDLNGEMVNVFRVLRDPVMASRLADLLRYTPCSSQEFDDAHQPHPDPVEQARRTIVRGFQGHGSTGASGGKLTGWRRRLPKYNDRYSHDWATVWACVNAWADRVREIYIENRDAMAVVKQWDAPDALHYLDPPYLPDTRADNCRLDGYAHEMSEADHASMAIVLSSLRGMVVLSGYPSPLYDELYAGWQRIEKRAMADHGRARTECLWFNPAAWAARPQGREAA